jgi:hypothetical protein
MIEVIYGNMLSLWKFDALWKLVLECYESLHISLFVNIIILLVFLLPIS